VLLETVGGVELYIDDITGTGGAAGWVLTECLVFGVKQAADTCENAGAQVEIVNLAAEVPPDVDAIFAEAIGTLATCTVGGANSGVVIGENLILAANGEALAVSEGDPTE
jgi:pyruvate/2-oxoglutarate/acetoin dehydrogenase E1 component